MNPQTDHPLAMLTEIYMEALLVDEDLADDVCEAWARSFSDGRFWQPKADFYGCEICRMNETQNIRLRCPDGRSTS